jgi:alpha-N-arabinofuranosidase
MYLGDFAGDLGDYLAQSIAFDDYLAVAEATCDYARAQVRSRKTMQLCVDEWNVWYHTRDLEQLQEYLTGADPVHHDTAVIEPWSIAPRLMEEIYTAADAVVVGAMLIVLLRHVRRVRVACISTIVNNVGAIMTTPGGAAWAQTIYYPLMHAAAYGRGTVLDVQVTSDCTATKSFGDAPLVDAVATVAGDDITLFAINRSRTERVALSGELRPFGACTVQQHLVLSHADPHAVNTASQPTTVRPRSDGNAEVLHDGLAATLPPVSWNVIRLRRSTG